MDNEIKLDQPLRSDVVAAVRTMYAPPNASSYWTLLESRIMARIGLSVFKEIDKDQKRVVPCVHSVGVPLQAGQADVPWEKER